MPAKTKSRPSTTTVATIIELQGKVISFGTRGGGKMRTAMVVHCGRTLHLWEVGRSGVFTDKGGRRFSI